MSTPATLPCWPIPVPDRAAYTGTPCRPKTVAVAALYHDAPEIITGDLPTPVKYHSATLRDAYKAMERESVASMTAMLPDELAEEVAPFLTGELLTAEETKLLKLPTG